MKKIILIVSLILLVNCNGYKPIFNSTEMNFYIGEINNISQDKISNKIERNLQPYKENNNKKRIIIDLETKKEKKVLSKNSEGDPIIFGLEISTKVKITFNNNVEKNLIFNKQFKFNNQSNKFEFQQYMNNIEKNLTDEIFQDLVLKLRLI
tara:strand:+ start:91 stop:543 length:453 start_codon:yes stop_codon:yes gene_type:complete